MNTHELHAFKARLWDAKTHNFKIGAAAGYVAALEAMAGPVPGSLSRGSIDHLLALVEKALKVGSPKPASHPEIKPKAAVAAPKPAPAPVAAKVEAPKPAPAPKKEEPKVEVKAEAKVEAKVEVAADSADDDLNF